MAKIIGPGSASSASGSVSGLTFSRSSAGLTLRSRKLGAGGFSPQQQIYRARFSRSAGRWRSFTDAQRLAWNTRAAEHQWTDALGQPFSPSGFQLFLATDMDRLTAGMTVGAQVPPAFTFLLPTFTNDAMTVGAGNWFVTRGPVQAGVTARVLRMSAPYDPGRSYVADLPMRVIIATNSTASVNIYTNYQNAWYQLGTRQRNLLIRVQLVNYAAGGAKSVTVETVVKVQ